MKVKVQKWGNSLGVRIPKALAEELKLENNKTVELTVEGGRLVAAPSPTLDELLEGITPDNVNRADDFDHPLGREIW